MLVANEPPNLSLVCSLFFWRRGHIIFVAYDVVMVFLPWHSWSLRLIIQGVQFALLSVLACFACHSILIYIVVIFIIISSYNLCFFRYIVDILSIYRNTSEGHCLAIISKTVYNLSRLYRYYSHKRNFL